MKKCIKHYKYCFHYFFIFQRELKCFQNDMFIYNNYANIFIIICYILTPKEYFDHWKNYEFLIHHILQIITIYHILLANSFIVFEVVKKKFVIFWSKWQGWFSISHLHLQVLSNKINKGVIITCMDKYFIPWEYGMEVISHRDLILYCKLVFKKLTFFFFPFVFCFMFHFKFCL